MEDKIKALADGTLDELRKALPGLTLEQLVVLKATEQAGKKRSGAIDMIDEAVIVLGGGGTPTADPADGDPPRLAPPAAPTQEQLAASPGHPPASPPPVADPAAGDLPPSDLSTAEEIAPDSARRVVLIVPSDRRDLIARLETAMKEGDIVALVFADADGELLAVPPIEAKAGDFQQFGGQHPKLIYKPRVDLPMTLPSVAVRQVFLLVEPHISDGFDVPAAVAVCRLTADLFAGGGRRAEIPDGNLLFNLS